jgi:hypothetical protein
VFSKMNRVYCQNHLKHEDTYFIQNAKSFNLKNRCCIMFKIVSIVLPEGAVLMYRGGASRCVSHMLLGEGLTAHWITSLDWEWFSKHVTSQISMPPPHALHYLLQINTPCGASWFLSVGHFNMRWWEVKARHLHVILQPLHGILGYRCST